MMADGKGTDSIHHPVHKTNQNPDHNNIYHDDSISKRQQIASPISSIIAHAENLNPANIHRADTKSNRSKPPIVIVPYERSIAPRVRNSGIARNQGADRRAVPRGSPDPARRRRGRLRRRKSSRTAAGGGGETQPRGGVAVNKEEKKFELSVRVGRVVRKSLGRKQTAIYNENGQAEEVA
jgi:hypothetical protein